MNIVRSAWRNKPPMTGRAKAYLWITALRTFPIALSCMYQPHLFSGAAYQYIAGVMPMWMWGVALLVQALFAAVAAVSQREWIARIALMVSASLAMSWVIGFILAYYHGNLLSPVGIMWGFGIAGKDLIVCRQPLWSPFEPLVQRVLRGEQIGRPLPRVFG